MSARSGSQGASRTDLLDDEPPPRGGLGLRWFAGLCAALAALLLALFAGALLLKTLRVGGMRPKETLVVRVLAPGSTLAHGWIPDDAQLEGELDEQAEPVRLPIRWAWRRNGEYGFPFLALEYQDPEAPGLVELRQRYRDRMGLLQVDGAPLFCFPLEDVQEQELRLTVLRPEGVDLDEAGNRMHDEINALRERIMVPLPR